MLKVLDGLSHSGLEDSSCSTVLGPLLDLQSRDEPSVCERSGLQAGPFSIWTLLLS